MAEYGIKTKLPSLYESYDYINPVHFTGKLKGKVVLITGASSGLGKETCLSFASAGASIACAARRKDRLDALVADIKSRHNVPAVTIQVDVSDPKTPKKLIAEVERELGPVDILINNAGITRMGPLATEQDFDRYWQVMEVNVRAPMALTHAVLPSMIARKTGTIINVSSRAVPLDFPSVTAYGISKTALSKFTQQLAGEVAAEGVLCYSIHPGTVATDFFYQDGAFSSPAIGEALMGQFKSMKTQGPEMMAHATVAMCADERWKVMNGKYLDFEQPLDEVLKEALKPGMGRIGAEDLYRVKVDIL